jgi:hypothetical protein
VVEVLQGGGGADEGQVIAWQNVPDGRIYQFVLSPGDYLLVVGSGGSVSVHIDAGAETTQDVQDSCQ